jgi:hypothetical protein
LETSDKRLEEVRRNAAFGEMQQKEVKFGLTHPDWPKDRFFNRRGQAGAWRDEMPEPMVRRFESMAGSTLQKMGYAIGETAG